MQIWFNGVCNGMLIALFAVAFSVVYIPSGVFYVAVAGIYVFAAYIAMQLMQWGIPSFLAFPVSVATGAALSMLFDQFNHMPLHRFGTCQ